MFKKESKLNSILFNKCPKCHKGDFMKEKNIFKLHKAFNMHESCSECGFKYMMEPSFYYGAMYVNYGLTVGIGVVTFALGTLLFGLTFLESFVSIVIMLLITAPVTIRLSRIIWINLFVNYDPASKKINENEQ